MLHAVLLMCKISKCHYSAKNKLPHLNLTFIELLCTFSFLNKYYAFIVLLLYETEKSNNRRIFLFFFSGQCRCMVAVRTENNFSHLFIYFLAL